MGKTEKLLLLIAVLLTVVAGAFWYVNLTTEDSSPNTDDLTPNSGQPTLDSGTGIQGGGPGENVDTELEVLENFGVEFEVVDETTVNLVLRGDTLNVRSAGILVSFDPEMLSVTSVENGDIFDFFISEGAIDAEAGTVELPFAFGGEDVPEVMTEGIIGTLKVSKLSAEPTTLTVVEYSDDAEDYSEIIAENGDKYTIAETSVEL